MSVLDDLVNQANETGTWGPVEGGDRPAGSVLDRLVQEANAARSVQPPVAEFHGQRLPGSDVELSTGQAILANIGAGFNRPIQGVKQLLGRTTPEQVDETRRMDAALARKVPGGGALQTAAEVAPAFALPQTRLGPALTDIGYGLGLGAVQPTGTGDSRAMNIGLGGLGGAVLPAMRGVGRTTARLSAEDEAAIALGRKFGMTPTVGNTTSNAIVKAFKKIGDESVIPGMSSAGINEANQTAFNKAFAKQWGGTTDAAGKVTKATRAGDQKVIGDQLDRVWSNNTMPYSNDLFAQLRAMEQRADLEPEAIRDSIHKRIADFEGRFQPDAQGNLVIPGEVANNFQKDLFKRYGGGKGGDLSHEMMTLRGHVIDNFNKSVSPADAEALTQARKNYRAFKSGDAAVDKADIGAAGRAFGDMAPQDVAAAAKLANMPEMSELSRAGQRFLVDRVPQTGGSSKALVQNSGVAAALAGLGYMNPASALALAGTGFGLTRAINSPSVLRGLVRDPDALGLPPASFANRMLGHTIARGSPMGALSVVNAYGPPEGN